MYRWTGPERTLRIDSWVNERLARHNWLQVKAFGWFFRMAHWLGWHHASIYSPDDSTVQGITFGTEEYVEQVIEAHEAMFGEPETEPAPWLGPVLPGHLGPPPPRSEEDDSG